MSRIILKKDVGAILTAEVINGMICIHIGAYFREGEVCRKPILLENPEKVLNLVRRGNFPNTLKTILNSVGPDIVFMAINW